MTLSEIYRKGADLLESKNLAFNLKGVETEFVLKNNEEVFKNYKFQQHAINSIEVTLETRLLDVELQVPIVMSSITAPIPQIQQNGLIKVARALKEIGSMMSLGSPVPSNLKDLVEVGVPLLQTVKPFADRSKVIQMISQAEAAGVSWVGIEVDAGQGTKVIDRPIVGDCVPMSVEELKEVKQKVSRRP